MAKQKAGSKKLRRSSADKGYYARFKEQYSGKLIRRKANRQKRIEAARLHPEIGSPSQLRQRRLAALVLSIPLNEEQLTPLISEEQMSTAI